MTYGDAEYRDRIQSYKACPDTTSGKHSPLNVHGKCDWCGKQIEAPMRRPDHFASPTELTWYYDQHYNPDWGGHNGH